MAQNDDAAKVPVTFRLEPDKLDRLKDIAREREVTVSSLISKAVEQVFITQGQMVLLEETFLTEEQLKLFLPVIAAIGKPISVSLFLSILQAQTG